MFLHDYNSALKYGAKILPSEILGAGLPFTGDYYYVKPYSGSDAASGKDPINAFKTLSQALSAAQANHGDVVFLVAESNTAASTFDFLTAALDWNKDGVHLIGISCEPFIGSRAGLRNSTSVTTIADLFTVSANNCLIANISVFQGDVSQAGGVTSRACVVSGMRNRFVNCQISGIGHSTMDDAGARSLAVTGAENTFQHCYIGLDTIIRATATTEVECANARNVFEDCVIESYTSSSTFKAFTVLASTTGRFVLLKNCLLSAIQNITSAAAPTGAIIHGSVSGSTYVMGSVVAGYAAVSTLDDANIYLNGPIGATAKAGLATGVDAA